MSKEIEVQEFYKKWWKEKQNSRPKPMQKPFGHYMNDKFNFAQAYADKVKLEHTIKALEDLPRMDNTDDQKEIDEILEKYQKQLEQLKAK